MENKDFHPIFTGLSSRLQRHILAVFTACIGLILIGYGLIASIMPTSPASDIIFEASQSDNKKDQKALSEKNQIVIDVSGAVQKPGVYRMPENARIEDALAAAGGFSEDVDFDWTQHSLNLAAKVSDGMKIYIPKVGEEIPLRQGFAREASGAVAGETTVSSTNGLVSINSASSSELEDLPGIGPVTAGKIIDNRPYSSIDELLSKKAVGKSTFEKIKTLISM